jgi:hypothetical protein
VRVVPRRRTVAASAIWLAFGAALVLATRPVWGQLLFGFEPTFEDLLQVRCLAVPWSRAP